MTDTRPLALFLMGPTASGKTDLAIRLRQRYPVEIISVDSALIYRDMDIGTAKPDQQELALAPASPDRYPRSCTKLFGSGFSS